MQFGMLYEMETPRPWNKLSEYNVYHEALAQIELADKVGFDYVWEVEHHFLEEYSHSPAPEVFYGAVSQRTKNIRLAHGVRLLPHRFNHPIKVAEQAAVLDILSNGHLVIGVGEGSTKLDFDALGLPFDERRKMVVDGVVALRSLLSQKGVSHHGPYYSFDNVTVSPRSIQRPCPPIWLSSWGSPVGLRRVARLGDGWVSSAWHATPEDFNDAWQILSTALGDQGRDPVTFPNAVNTMFMYVDEDGDRARQVAVPIIEAATGTPFDGDSGHFIVGDYAECRALTMIPTTRPNVAPTAIEGMKMPAGTLAP